MYLSGYVRDKETNQHLVIEQTDYTSKEKFAKDLRSNGYAVIRISNKRDIQAQDHGYESVAAIKKQRKDYISFGQDVFTSAIEKLDNILAELERVAL